MRKNNVFSIVVLCIFLSFAVNFVSCANNVNNVSVSMLSGTTWKSITSINEQITFYANGEDALLTMQKKSILCTYKIEKNKISLYNKSSTKPESGFQNGIIIGSTITFDNTKTFIKR